MVKGRQVLEKTHGGRQMLGKHEAESQKLENEVSKKQWTAPKEQYQRLYSGTHTHTPHTLK